jgi:hypothetical protein
MLLKIFLLFLLAGSSLCQFFTNGRYGKRSQSAFMDDQVSGKLLAMTFTVDLSGRIFFCLTGGPFEMAPVVDVASLPRLSCVYTGYQTLYSCHRSAI